MVIRMHVVEKAQDTRDDDLTKFESVDGCLKCQSLPSVLSTIASAIKGITDKSLAIHWRLRNLAREFVLI